MISRVAMNDKEILEAISDYIKNGKYNYAVLIDGAWGCGKTHFIKNQLCKLITEIPISACKKHFNPIYISLYGIASIEDVTNKLQTILITHKLGSTDTETDIKNPMPKLFGIGVNLADTFIKSNSLLLQGKEAIANYIGDIGNFVYIFDDLERCALPINEILGFINSLVEQNNAKVIIVANEKEIGKLNYHTNTELKFLVASQNNLVFLRQKDPLREGMGLSDNEVAINVDEIKRRSTELFSEDALYCQIREKLIGATFVYQANLRSVLPALIDTFFSQDQDKTLNAILKELLNEIISVFDLYHYSNIRTAQFALQTIKKLFTVIGIQNLLIDKTTEPIAATIILAAFHVSIAYKDNKKPHVWSENTEYETISYFDVYCLFRDKYFQSLKFIHDYIEKSFFDKSRIETIISEYQRYFTEVKAESSNDPLNILSNYWIEMEDDDVEKMLKEIIENLYQNKYLARNYKKIIALLLKLEKAGFDCTNIEDITLHMEAHLKKTDDTLDYHIGFELENGIREKYTFIVDRLIASQSEGIHTKYLDEINSIISSGSGWGERMEDYISENKDKFLNEHAFFAYADMEKCKSALESCTVKDFCLFRACFYSVYNFSNLGDYYLADKENLMVLKQFLESSDLDRNSRVMKCNKEYFVRHLEDIIRKLEPNTAQ